MSKLGANIFLIQTTGGPPLTRKSLTWFPLTRFLAYVRVSGGISVRLTRVSCNTHYVGPLYY